MLLIDRLHKATFKKENWFYAGVKQQLRDAQRFVLDNEMASFLADLGWAYFDRYKAIMQPIETIKGPTGRAAFQTIDKRHRRELARIDQLLNDTRVLARIPFATTWIEYDFRARFSRQLHHNPTLSAGLEDVSPGIGYLLTHYENSETTFKCTLVLDHPHDDTAIMSPWSYIWSTDDDPLPRGVDWLKLETHGSVAVGYRGPGNEWEDHVRIVETWPLPPHLKMLDENNKRLWMLEFAGELRYIWSLLAAINDVPTTKSFVKPQRGFMARGSIRNFFSHSVVHLHVPKDTTVTQLAKHVVARTRQRAHRVRGHWRTNWRDPSGPKIWVREHVAGDATLGWVYQDYSVEKEHA